jgi:ABC-2 type transport system ATP-binding protein
MICDRVAILNKGDLIKEGSVDDLTRQENIFEIHCADTISLDLKQKILNIDGNAGIGEKEVHTEKGIKAVNKMIDLLRSNNIVIKGVSQRSSTLEELFINVIKQDNLPMGGGL